MNRRRGILAALVAAFVLASMVGTYQVDADAPEYVYINADKDSPEARRFLSRGDVQFRHGFRDGFSVKLEATAKRELKSLGFSTSSVAVYYPHATPSDPTPYGIEQIYSDTGVSQTSGGDGVTIGHLDTGIDRNHPDLVRRVVGCKDATSGVALSSAANNTCEDLDGHGTHTAGLAVADGGVTGDGIWGVAPEADLYSIVVCDADVCYADAIAAAIDYLGSLGYIDIITMSIGGPSSDSRIAAAIDRHKDSILFVASAGNMGPAGGSIEYPAWDPDVVAVAAIDNTEAVTNFSSRGIDDGDDSVITIGEIEFAAAGKIVESTYPTDLDASGYAYFSGTSMAAPHVAGLAAKLWDSDPDTTRMKLRASVTDITSGRRAETGYDVASGYGLPHVSSVAPPPPPPSDPALVSIDVTPSSKSIEKGKSQQYRAVGKYDDGSTMDITSGATWNSSDRLVATVDGAGMAIGVDEGTSMITANMGGMASNDAKLVVNLTPPAVLEFIHVGEINGESKPKKRSKWQAYATVMVHDSGHNSVRRAKVEATWSTSEGVYSATCRVKRDGYCKLKSPRFDSRVSDVTLQIDGINHRSLSYNAAENDITSLVIFKP